MRSSIVSTSIVLVALLSAACAYHGGPSPQPNPADIYQPPQPGVSKPQPPPVANPPVVPSPPQPPPPIGPVVPPQPPSAPPPVYIPPVTPLDVVLLWMSTIGDGYMLVNFSFSVTGTSGQIESVTYEFGDGTSTTIDHSWTRTLTTLHQYGSATGPYEVKVSVRDSSGRVASDHEWITRH